MSTTTPGLNLNTMADPATLSAPSHSPPGRLADRVACITGASSGLGRQIALAYASHGAKLIVCADLDSERRATDYRENDDAGLKNDLPTHELIDDIYGVGKAIFVRCDVGDSREVEHLVAETVRVGGRLDIMVNNAGLAISSNDIRVHEEDDETWDRMMRVNLRGVYLGCKFAARQMLLGQDALPCGRRGWIVNVASMLGYVGLPGGSAAYCASKGGALNLTRQVALDYAKDRIHVNALCPGFTKTGMTRPNFERANVHNAMRDTTPWGEWGVARDVAKAAVFLASDDAAWVTGVGLPVDGGYLAQ